MQPTNHLCLVLGLRMVEPSPLLHISSWNGTKLIKHRNFIFTSKGCTLFISLPRADASSFLHSEPILNASLAAATARSTSAYKTTCTLLIRRWLLQYSYYEHCDLVELTGGTLNMKECYIKNFLHAPQCNTMFSVCPT